jgi:hypothetical protein
VWRHLPAGAPHSPASSRHSRSDLRLTALDEIENDLIVLREEKLMQFLWTKAAKHSNLCIYRGVLKIWKRLCFNTALIKRQRRLVFERSALCPSPATQAHLSPGEGRDSFTSGGAFRRTNTADGDDACWPR